VLVETRSTTENSIAVRASSRVAYYLAELTERKVIDHPDKPDHYTVGHAVHITDIALREQRYLLMLPSHDAFGDNGPTPTFVMCNHAQFQLRLRIIPFPMLPLHRLPGEASSYYRRKAMYRRCGVRVRVARKGISQVFYVRINFRNVRRLVFFSPISHPAATK
jgi:hypothetical protein